MAINTALAERMNLTKRDVKKLDVLHELMNSLVHQQNWYHERVGLTKKKVKALRKVVRQMEYTMQMIWGFEEDKSKHYHWKRFSCLREHPPKCYTKMSPPVDPGQTTVHAELYSPRCRSESPSTNS